MAFNSCVILLQSAQLGGFCRAMRFLCTWIVLSDPQLYMRSPAGDTATPYTPPLCAFSVLSRLPSFTLHTLPRQWQRAGISTLPCRAAPELALAQRVARISHLMVESCDPDRSSLSSGLSARQRTGAEWDASRRRSRPLPTLHTLISLSSGPVEPAKCEPDVPG